MSTNNSTLFGQYAATIEALDLSRIKVPAQIPRSMCLDEEGELRCDYIPFDYVNPDARLVVVGITPGFTQWVNAIREAQIQIRGGAPATTALRAAKQTGAFSGAMRPNLVSLLDHIGIAQWLGISSCDALFKSGAHLIQTTSILRHPVFVDQANYSGAPSMIRTPLLQRQIEAHFVEEARLLCHAVFVPLGPKVSEGLDWLVQRGILPGERVLDGLPHPSGANAERIAYFPGRKPREALSMKTDATKLDASLAHLRAQVHALR
ncbi:hypothetical protein [Paraburkholderia sp. C35]|uniref:hypothetical protein n=1 Tax=Paraburkholderia sp. C35 TaxID=2126993 RepID=UPI000D69EC6C|nr:hypothetical protein [Paraburkholderia sp. C35]